MSEPVNDAGPQPNVRSRDQQHNPLLHMRDRLFFALFCRVSLLYARSIPRYLQRTLEFLLLFEALMALGLLTFVHMAFVHKPVDCLHHVHDVWPKNGILRVEIIKNASIGYTLNDSYRKLAENFHLVDLELIDMLEISTGKTEIMDTDEIFTTAIPEEEEKTQTPSIAQNLNFYLQPYLYHLKKFTRWWIHEDIYVVEYSLEYGLLRMTPRTRNHLNVTVMLVILDPTKDECFGGWFSQAMLEEFLGYEDVLLSSLHQLAKKQNNSGFFRNVMSGDHYRFVEVSVSRFSYVTAAFLMIFFTLSISMLLRYAHQQIFLFIVDLLQVFDRNSLITFPLAPLLTAVLALIGVEALMSELFIEASTAFYVILIVWLADQYDVICCHTNFSKRHWLRFFYLYHFVFYAYHYRFNGHFSSITLATSWLFTQHSMVYFFHHYELPSIIHQARVQHLILQAQRQSAALQAAGRDGTDPVSRPEASGGQQVNYGAVVAFIPEDLSGQTRQQDDVAAEGVGLSNTDGTRRFGQQSQTWSLFNLPSFRFSNSLILAQVFVRQQPDSSRRASEQLTQDALPVSNDGLSNSANVSEATSQDLRADVGNHAIISPSFEMPRDTDTSTDAVDDIPWKLEEKMDATEDHSNKNDPIQVMDREGGGGRTNTKTTANSVVVAEASLYHQNDNALQLHHLEQSTAEFDQNIAVLPDHELKPVASANDESTSLAPDNPNHTSHTVRIRKNNSICTADQNQIQELSSFAIGTDSETVSSQDSASPVDNENQTYYISEEIEKCDAASD